MKKERLYIRVEEQDKKKIEKAAELEKKTTSEFALSAALNKARRVLRLRPQNEGG